MLNSHLAARWQKREEEIGLYNEGNTKDYNETENDLKEKSLQCVVSPKLSYTYIDLYKYNSCPHDNSGQKQGEDRSSCSKHNSQGHGDVFVGSKIHNGKKAIGQAIAHEKDKLAPAGWQKRLLVYALQVKNFICIILWNKFVLKPWAILMPAGF